MAKRTKSVKQTQPADSGGKTLSEFFAVLRELSADTPAIDGYEYHEAFSPAYLIDHIEADLRAGQVARAVMQAVTLGAEMKRLANWPVIAEKLRQESGLEKAKENRRRRSDEQAAIARDRVSLLVKCGKGKGEAQETAAKDLGLSRRQVQRYCKIMRHDPAVS